MSGADKCACCGLHYPERRGDLCWFCSSGLDPRGPWPQTTASCVHCYSRVSEEERDG